VKSYNLAGDSGDFTSVAVQSKGVTALVNSGDKEGYGVEATRNLGDLSVTVNAEENATSDSQRAGAGADYAIGDLTIGAGFDNIKTSGKEANQELIRAYRTLEKDQFGAGLRKQEESNSADTFWCHFNDSVGHRTYAKCDWNDETEDKCIVFDSIVAQNPTFSTASSPWFTGRNAGDMFDRTTIENPNSPERVPVNNRSKKGLVGEIKYTDAERETKDGVVRTQNVRVDAGYTFPQVSLGNLKFKPGIITIYNKCFENPSKDCAGLSGIVNCGDFTLEATASRSVEDFSSNDSTESYVSVNYCKKF
jgi:hypothetical protein